MAKRKRLGPALIGGDTSSSAETVSDMSGDAGRPPIARVAGDAAGQAALSEVAAVLTEARQEGRLIQKLPLTSIDTGHLVRDRLTLDEEALSALRESLRARGQQAPIEVVALEGPARGSEPRYGLISGLRRVQALRDIGAETVLALVRTPKSSADAYLAMVEENEIRAGVSFYERARLAHEAARLGLYDTPQAAIAALFAQASPAKKSKIGSFVSVYRELGSKLQFPAAIPERLGLALAQALAEPGFRDTALERLTESPAKDAAEERAVLEAALKPVAKAKPGSAQKPQRTQVHPGLYLEQSRGRVSLTGPKATAELADALVGWLKARQD